MIHVAGFPYPSLFVSEGTLRKGHLELCVPTGLSGRVASLRGLHLLPDQSQPRQLPECGVAQLTVNRGSLSHGSTVPSWKGRCGSHSARCSSGASPPCLLSRAQPAPGLQRHLCLPSLALSERTPGEPARSRQPPFLQAFSSLQSRLLLAHQPFPFHCAFLASSLCPGGFDLLNSFSIILEWLKSHYKSNP